MIEIRHRGAHSLADVLQHAGLRRDVVEGAVATIAIQPIRQSLEDTRMAINPYPTRNVATRAVGVRRPVDVIDDEQVETPVVVEVEPGAGHTPLTAGNPGAFGHIVEAAVAAVAQQLVLPHTGDEEIDVAVVVVVGRGGAHGVADTTHTGRLGDVGETHLPIIPIETVRVVGRALLERRGLGAVGEENVGTAVAVVVEDSQATWCALDEVLPRGRRMMVNEAQTAGFGHVSELRRLWCDVL